MKTRVTLLPFLLLLAPAAAGWAQPEGGWPYQITVPESGAVIANGTTAQTFNVVLTNITSETIHDVNLFVQLRWLRGTAPGLDVWQNPTDLPVDLDTTLFDSESDLIFAPPWLENRIPLFARAIDDTADFPGTRLYDIDADTFAIPKEPAIWMRRASLAGGDSITIPIVISRFSRTGSLQILVSACTWPDPAVRPDQLWPPDKYAPKDVNQQGLYASVSTISVLAPVIAVSPASLDFGQVVYGESAARNLMVTNNGDTALVIHQIRSSNPLFNVPAPPAAILPGAAAEIAVSFTAAQAAAFTETLSIISNDPFNPVTSIPLQAAVISGKLSVSPDALVFGQVPAGTAKSLPLTISNIGLATLDISDITWDSQLPLSMAAKQFSLAAGSSTTLDVVLAPVTLDAWSGSLLITHNDPSTATPLAVPVSGGGSGAVMAAEPLAGDFGGLKINAPDTLIITIGNSGNIDLQVQAPTIFGPDAAEFSVAGGSQPFNVAAGASAIIAVIFQPSSRGSKVAALTLSSSAWVNPFLTIPLRGQGTAPSLAATPESVNLGQVALGASRDTLVLLDNRGDAELQIFTLGIGGGAFTLVNAAVPRVIATGQSDTLRVRYSPGTIGAVRDELVISSDDPERPTTTIVLAGEGVDLSRPVITLDPGALRFGTVTVGEEKWQVLTIRNSGTRSLAVTGISASDGTILLSRTRLTIAPGMQDTVAVGFKSSIIGEYSGSVQIESDDPDQPLITIPVSAEVVAAPVPAIVVTPESLDFGRVVANSTSERILTIGNTGTAPLTVDSLSSSEAALTISPARLTVAPGGQATVRVTFHPGRVGSFSHAIEVFSDDPARPALMIPVLGEASAGRGPDIANPHFAEQPRLGSPAVLRVTAAAVDSKTGSVVLHYRRGGESDFATVAMSSADSASWSATITPSEVTLAGLCWFIVAESELGAQTRWPEAPGSFAATGVIVPAAACRQLPWHRGNTMWDYRLASVPYRLNASAPQAVFADLGAEDRTRWRLLDYVDDGTAATAADYRNFSQMRPVIPGRGFFMLCVADVAAIDAGSGLGMPPDTTVSISLSRGHNLIGNPYGFPLPASALRPSNGDSIKLDEIAPSGWQSADTLHPWHGYHLWVADTCRLMFTPAAVVTQAIQQSTIAAELSMELELDGKMQRRHHAGVRQGAAAGYDRYDAHVPPSLGEETCIYTQAGDYQLYEDWRGPADAKQWRLIVRREGREAAALLRLRPEKPTASGHWYLAGPGISRRRIIAEERLNLGELIYTAGRCELDLVWQPEAEAGVDDAAPAAGLLLSGYPNPFNAEITIHYELPEGGQVELAIVNLRGEMIRRLLPPTSRHKGSHRLTWNGTGDDGIQAPSGLYYLHLRTHSGSRFLKVIYLR